MSEFEYVVFIGGLGDSAGRFNTLTNAIIFAEALFNKYYNEPTMQIFIRREMKGENHE